MKTSDRILSRQKKGEDMPPKEPSKTSEIVFDVFDGSPTHISGGNNSVKTEVAEVSSPDLLIRIKAILSRGPVPYSEVLTQTGTTEDEIRTAIRDWYDLVSGPIAGVPHWWIASQDGVTSPVQVVGQITSHEEAIRLIQGCLTTKELWNLIDQFPCDWPKEEFQQVWKALTHQDDVLVDWGDKSMWSHSAVFEEVD